MIKLGAQIIASLTGLFAAFAHVFGDMSTEDATYLLAFSVFILVTQQVFSDES